MTQLTAKHVAVYFLSLVDNDCGDSVSNLKLQKLVYYAQGVYLALRDKPLFNDKIFAWEHGPVVPSLYKFYSHHGSTDIPKPSKVDYSIYNKKAREVMDDVYKVFGQFSAWKLRNMTHEEPPWKDTPINTEISHESMKKYFKTLLN